ncbi:MAG: Ni/Fe hydrogenase subunit alpha [Theionarchaea archaeon]|nr:Ni/Fe hydrogenase subunit alpha [Theionarchaea archaeon]MBU7037931.1 Ni/Fe hydrogenase subunit alpha [Theionarchaea archaeon]
MSEIAIKVDHLTRVEGHGNIILNARDGIVEKVQWQVTEAPRMFESFVRGRHYHQVSHVMSRICGICSIGHALCSLKATEAAMGVTISDETELLRKVALHAENMQSHILHVGYLVAPDLFRKGSVFPLIETHPDAVLKIVSLHRLANQMSDLICGRTTHPITLMVGGFTKIPSEKELSTLRDRLVSVLPVCDEVNQLLMDNLHLLPDFTRETEYIGLTSDTEYALYDGVIGSTDTGTHAVADYESIANEYMVPYSTAKFAKHARESYMVGALARFNLNAANLTSGAKAWAQKFGLSPINCNPFMNNAVQLVEYYHSVEDSIRLLDAILDTDLKNETATYTVKAGRGVGAIEVPRGILFHDYTYDDQGFCTKANCIIPSNQNHKNINLDLEAFVPTLLDLEEKEIELNLEMLVRAYDPCISCSTHYLTVEFT